MSQIIRKLQNGDKAPEVKQARLFKDGNRDIDLDVLIRGANKNIDQYLQSKNWSRKKKQAFMDAYSDIMNSLDSGAIAQRGVDRKYTDTTGRIQNSQGRGFDAYGEAAHFLDTIVDIVPDYQKEKPKERTKYDANGLINTFKNKFFGGSDPDAIIWQGRDTKDEKTGKYGTANRASAFAQMLDDYAASLADSDYDYEGSAFKDREDLIARLQTASAQLRDGTFDNNDYSALTALGISGETARTLFSTDALEEAGTEGDKTPDDPELAEAEEGLAQVQKNQERQQKIDEWKKLQEKQRLSDELSRKWYEPARDFQDQIIQLPTVTLNMDQWIKSLRNKTITDQYYKNFQNLFTQYDPYTHQSMMIDSLTRDKDGKRVSVNYLQHIANNLSYLNQMGLLKDSGIDGYKYYPDTIDEKTGTVVLYNPSTNTYMKKAVFKVPALLDLLLNQNADDNPFAMKHGGVVAFQFGGQTDYGTAFENYVNSRNSQKKAAEDKKIEEKAKASGRTKEEIKAGQRELNEASDLSATDWTRLGAAAADVASIAAAFAPGAGTIASAGLGVGSTLANLGADIFDDSVSAEDTALNAITGLGMDLVGLVPGFGAAGKSAKIVKNVVKLAPKILTLWGTAQAYEPAKEALSKLMNNKDLTVDDWKALAAGLGAIAGLSRMGLASMKTRAMKQNFGTGDKTVQSKSGKMMRATPEELEKLKGAKSLEEANKIVQNLKSGDGKGQELAATFRGWYNPTRLWNNNPRTGEHFDFARSETSRIRGKDVNIFRRAVNSDIPLPSWHWNWSLKNPYSKGKPITPRQQSQVAGYLPSSRRFRLKEKGLTDKELNRRGIYKQGGILFAKDGIRNVISSDDVNWLRDIYNSKGFLDTLAMITPENIDTYNNMQNQYATLGFTNQKPGDNLSFNQAVADYQTLFQKNTQINNQTMADLIKRGVIKGRGNSSDKGVDWTADGLAGTQTWLRHLGTVLGTDYQTLAKMNETLNKNGVEAFYNRETGMVNYRVKPKETPAPVQPTVQQPVETTAQTQTQPQTRNTQVQGAPQRGNTNKGTWLSAFIDQAPNFLAAGRLAGNIANNNRVTAEVKKGLKPLIENTYNLHRRVQGDLATRQAYYTKAAELENLAARPMTSDASLQLAGQLEAKSKGNQYRTQGDLADNQAIRESAEKAWQVQADNTARRSAVANANRARILKNNAALHNLEAGRMSANWQSIDNFLKQREYAWRTKRNQQRQFDLGVIKNYLSNKYSETPQMEALRKQILAKADKKEDYSDLYSQYLRLKQDQNTQFTNDYNDAYARIYGLRFNSPTPTYRPFLKDGGKIEVARIKAKTESAKLFQENIKESVRNNIKMIDNLSRVTKELILKSMSL